MSARRFQADTSNQIVVVRMKLANVKATAYHNRVLRGFCSQRSTVSCFMIEKLRSTFVYTEVSDVQVRPRESSCEHAELVQRVLDGQFLES